MSTASSNPFADKFNRPETAPGPKAKAVKKASASKEIPAVEPLEKTAATFRLSTRALRLVALAVNEARQKGTPMSKQEIVDRAIRETFDYLEPEG